MPAIRFWNRRLLPIFLELFFRERRDEFLNARIDCGLLLRDQGRKVGGESKDPYAVRKAIAGEAARIGREGIDPQL